MVFFRDVGYTDARLPPGFPSTPPPTLGTRGREAGGPWSPRAAQRVRLRCEHMDGARASAKPWPRITPGDPREVPWCSWLSRWETSQRGLRGVSCGWSGGGGRTVGRLEESQEEGEEDRGEAAGSRHRAHTSWGPFLSQRGHGGGPCSRGAGCVARRGRTLSARGRFQSKAEACEDQGRPRAGRIWS